ncbi:MAG: hypothetical protein NXH73_04555 [Flavobacteriaceae bacterium]|nr:hypothetical protein [Flavobacteriaceae bacterium]
MSNTSQTTSQQEEIDLGYLIKKINHLFKRAVVALYEVISFYLKHKFIVLAIIIVGFAYGFYKETTSKPVLNNKAIVIPNFESVDYLYEKVDALNAKIQSKDSVYLKSIFGSNQRRVKKIEIEPISDLYNFAAKSRENIDILRILFKDQEVSEFVEDITTSKYFKYHKLNVKIAGNSETEEVFKQIISFFNENSHFSDYKNDFIENNDWQIEIHKQMITQIDSILTSVISNAGQSNQGVLISDNSQLHNLIERKRLLAESSLKLKMQSVDFKDVIKVVSVDFNLLDTEGFKISPKIKYPILLLFFFTLFFFFRYLFKTLKRIAEKSEN